MKSNREWLYKEPLAPAKLTPTEAFEEGKRMGRGEIKGEDNYDIAARAFARAILECAERHPKQWMKVSAKIDQSKRPENTGDNWCKKGKGQDLLLEAMDFFEKKLADTEYEKLSKEIGPSMFQAGWAFQEAYHILKTEEEMKSES